MTISTTSIKAVATGNSATTVWPFAFLIPNQASLIVTLIDIATGNPTVLSPVNYTVTGFGNAAGGSVTYPLSGSPLTSATQLVIQRAAPNIQSTSFINQGAAYPADIEYSLDYLTMLTQQLADTQSRSIVFSIADTIPQQLPVASARASKYLGFDAAGGPIATPGPLAGVAVSVAMTPVVQAATTAAALALLGIPGSLLDLLIPSGTCWDYDAGGAAPAGFVYPIGQPCTSTYPDYRAKLISAGSPYGTNGTDPLMPDKRGAVSAGKSNMGGTDNGLLPGGTVLGAILGASTRVIVMSNLPPWTPTGTVSAPSLTAGGSAAGGLIGSPATVNETNSGPLAVYQSSAFATISVGTPIFTGIAMGGTSTPMSMLQLTMVCNKILKVH